MDWIGDSALNSSRIDTIQNSQNHRSEIAGQGLEGFMTSFASGYAIAVVPAVTENVWGGTLVQALTNAVGKLAR